MATVRVRKAVDVAMTTVCWVSAIIGISVLGLILFDLFAKGFAGLSLSVFTKDMAAPGSNGGLKNAILGSFFQVGLGIALAAPLGILAGVYMAEYGRRGRFAPLVRFVNDLLLSAPSVLIGLFVYELVVQPTGGFSGFAGGVALMVVAFPIVARATEDMLSLVPDALRDGADALGSRRHQTVFSVVLPAAWRGILTAILLAVARIAGETAPLIFTSLGNSMASFDPSGPIASLPIAIYQYAGSPADDWVALAWTGALIVTLGVLGLNIASRALQAYAGRKR
jgi:phosphate transport system permease protein